MKNSLQFRLSAWLALVIVGVAIIAGTASFVLAYREAIELQDDQLRQTASVVDPQSIARQHQASADTDVENRLVVQVLAPPDAGSASTAFPATLSDGMQTFEVRGVFWRVFVKSLAAGERVAVGQRTALRDEIARDGALATVAPFLILMPILLLLVGDVIRKMFAPLKRLAVDLDRSSDQDLRALGSGAVPQEIRPFVQSIDRLLSRLAQAAALQRRFVADAAHELRSPLTALSLQAQQLEAADMSAPARQRLTAMRGGIQRTRVLLEQLLTLARVQEPTSGDSGVVSLRGVVRQVLEDLMPLAEAKHIDLGVERQDDVQVRAIEMDVRTLVKNLTDNAIRYTPVDGRIDLRMVDIDGRGLLQIDDTGPGIDEHERERVFDPFYRVVGSDADGSGLGLSIVAAIAKRLGARISLGFANEPTRSGLRVQVTFPSATEAAAASSDKGTTR